VNDLAPFNESWKHILQLTGHYWYYLNLLNGMPSSFQSKDSRLDIHSEFRYRGWTGLPIWLAWTGKLPHGKQIYQAGAVCNFWRIT
jgi:hypothetical protein